MILLFLKRFPRLHHIQDSHLQLLWNCIVDQNIWGNNWEVSIILKSAWCLSECSCPWSDTYTEICLWELILHNRIILIEHNEYDDPENSNVLPRVIFLDYPLIFLTETSKFFFFFALYETWEFQKVNLWGIFLFSDSL